MADRERPLIHALQTLGVQYRYGGDNTAVLSKVGTAVFYGSARRGTGGKR